MDSNPPTTLQGKNIPFVSIIIPCRNEKKFIGRCLDSIIANNYPKDRLEILVGDGMSEDGTREIIEKYIQKYPFISFFDNPKKIAPAAQNIGLKNAKGEIIIILDAHSSYEKDFISNSVRYLKEYNADCVGGIIKTIPREDSLIAKAIVLVLTHPFGAGNAYFRIGLKKPIWTDSVPFASYKKEVFEKIGNFNENLASSYDRDFNLRLKKAGGKILLAPDILSYYYARSSFRDFLKHDFSNGFWVTYPLKFGVKIFSLRHLLPLFFVLTLPLNIWFYIPISLFFSVQIATKERDFRFLFLMPIAFFARHTIYGLGSLWGLIKLIR